MGVIATNVVKELTKLGYDVGLNAINSPNDPNKVNPNDYPPEVREALLKGHRFDSVNIFFAYPDIYPHSRCKVNVGYTGADSTGWYTTQGQIPPWISCNEYMDFMLTPADYSRRIMKGCGVTKPIYLFPHGIDTSLFPYQSRVKNIPFTFVYCGEMSKRKGTQDLINTFKDLFGTSDKYRLILRSNTDMLYYNGSEIEALTRNQPNIEVHFKNFGQQELSEYYKRGHVYVYPSRADWFGMTPFESLATGMPTIATATNGYYEFLKDYIIPLKFEDKEIGKEHPYLKGKWHVVDREHLKEQMFNAVFNYEDELKRAKNASDHIHKNFTWEKVTKDYLVPFLDKIDHKSVYQVPQKTNFVVDPVKKETIPVIKDFRVTVGIPTKDRGIELAMLLQSLTAQTYQNFDVLINDDGLTGILNNNTTIQGLFKYLRQTGHDVTIMKGKTLGPHVGGQAILDNAKTELILRLDDDVALEPQFIEKLVEVFKDDDKNEIAAVGPIYLNPHEDLSKQKIDLKPFERQYRDGAGRIFWLGPNQLFISGLFSVNRLPVDYPIEVEHLYSGFMYRTSVAKQIGGYYLELSKVGHREETIFSYSMFKAGYKLFIQPNSIAYHYHPMQGGIRETTGQIHKEELWKHDEEIFTKWIRNVLPPPGGLRAEDLPSEVEQYGPSLSKEPSPEEQLMDKVQELFNKYLSDNKDKAKIDKIQFQTLDKKIEETVNTSDIPEITPEQIKQAKPIKEVYPQLFDKTGNKPKLNLDEYQNNKLVSIVILTHGEHHKGLRDTVKGIVDYTKVPYEIVIVNNDTRTYSITDLEELVNNEYRDKIARGLKIKVINLPVEVEVGTARNIGVENVSEESEHIVFIDDDATILGFPDARFGTDWIDFMLSIFNESKDVAAVSPIHTWYHPLKCYAVSVACMLTSKKVWGVVGGFDGVFGNKEKGTWGYEDVDWSYRAISLGYKLKWIGHPNAFPFYHIDTTLKPKSESQANALIKAQQILHSKYNLEEIELFSRIPYPFTREQMEDSVNGIKLNVGCYYTHFDDFINIDIKNDCGADLISDMRSLDQHFAPESVSLILSSHSLEHVTKEDAAEVIKIFNKILRPGGHLVVEVPDCENMDERIAKGEMTEYDKQCHIEGMPSEFGQKHEHCYVESELRNILNNNGFYVIRRNPQVSVAALEDRAIRLDCVKRS
jgi:GT2 family glycosyltransferase/glycosyltransferase involved in cell wall biosynthesis/predicted SAM-dependent methyltransferase